ncbi:MAG: DUF998 domain-containing protein [Promethearchaeota archaeon]
MKSENKRNKLSKLNERIENWLSSPIVGKWAPILALLTFPPMLLIGYIVAQWDPAGPGDDPAGYDIFHNMISDLGSVRYTPSTIFLDFGAMITACWLFPIVFYLERKFAPIPKTHEDFQRTSRWRFRLVTFGTFFMHVGIIGLFGIGLFSEDRSKWMKKNYGIAGLHGLFSVIVFGGLVLAGMILGFFLLFYENDFIPRIARFILGPWMMIVPLICALNFMSYSDDIPFGPVPPSISFWEWMMLFSIMAWLIPVGFFTILDAQRELKARKIGM